MNPEQQLSYNKFLEENASITGALEFANEQGLEQGIKKGIQI